MNKTEAFKELRRRWGEKARYRCDDKAPTKEEREAMDLTELAAAAEKAEAARQARRDELLTNDAEYQRLEAASIAARKAKGQAAGLKNRYRRVIGYQTDMGAFTAFHVMGQGDTWAEAFAEADRRR